MDIELIYAPEILKVRDEIIISIRVFLSENCFKSTQDCENVIGIGERKRSLELLFERLGLLEKITVNSVLQIGDQISTRELSRIYSKAGLLDKKLEKIKVMDGFAVKLRDYQETALSFMIKKEKEAAMDSKGMSPLWVELKPPNSTPFYYNRHSGELSLDFPFEEHCNGGILADEMGLGKTIEILSLIYTNQYVTSPKKKGDTTATLIVCPLNLVSQWKEESERCFSTLNKPARVFYGSERGDFEKTDSLIVITTYGTLSSEFDHYQKNSALYSKNWHRIVLDEGHLIKEKTTKTAKAAYALKGTNRWVVTGTPIINKLE